MFVKKLVPPDVEHIFDIVLFLMGRKVGIKELQLHILYTHEKPFKCEACGKTFNVKAALKDHKRAHTGEKPFACGKCKKASTTGGALRIHRVETQTG